MIDDSEEPVTDPYGLQRFVWAQDGVYNQVVEELRAGRKRTHWMWFIFPQIAGLGASEMARAYAISGVDEAAAYLGHALLGARLRECTALVNAARAGWRIEEIFGYPDDLKFRSSMTLFGAVAPEESVFRVALERYFDGRGDEATLRKLG